MFRSNFSIVSSCAITMEVIRCALSCGSVGLKGLQPPYTRPRMTGGFTEAWSTKVPRKPGNGHPIAASISANYRHTLHTACAHTISPRTNTRNIDAHDARRLLRVIEDSNDKAPPVPSALLHNSNTRRATILRANSYPEVTDRFCRLPFPTLVYAAKGCSPQRPAVDIGTNRREDSAWLSPGFSRFAWGSRTPPQRAVLFGLVSLSPD